MRIADIIIGERHRKRKGDIEGLARSIDELGLLNPVTVTEDGRLIAGWRRIQACLSLGWQDIAANVVQGTSALTAELAEIDENLQREELTVLERGEHLARRKEIYEEMHPETRQGAQGGGRAGKGTRQRTETETISFSVEAATATGVTPRTIRQEVQIATALADDVKETIRDTDLADSKTELLLLARQTPEEQRAIVDKIVAHQAEKGKPLRVLEAKRQATGERLAKQSLPSGKYRVILADPPWQYGNTNQEGFVEQRDHYRTMTIPELCAMSVREMADDNAVLFLWVTSPILEDAFAVIRAWGFEYKASFIWDKVKHVMGHYNSVRHELLLVCTRGACQPDKRQLFDSVVTEERTEHSRKPETFRQIIDTIYPYGRRIELFARTTANGWDAHGNERPEIS